jgi:hypothetical protein
MWAHYCKGYLKLCCKLSTNVSCIHSPYSILYTQWVKANREAAEVSTYNYVCSMFFVGEVLPCLNISRSYGSAILTNSCWHFVQRQIELPYYLTQVYTCSCICCRPNTFYPFLNFLIFIAKKNATIYKRCKTVVQKRNIAHIDFWASKRPTNRRRAHYFERVRFRCSFG